MVIMTFEDKAYEAALTYLSDVEGYNIINLKCSELIDFVYLENGSYHFVVLAVSTDRTQFPDEQYIFDNLHQQWENEVAYWLGCNEAKEGHVCFDILSVRECFGQALIKHHVNAQWI
jgi:hypothetical protein